MLASSPATIHNLHQSPARSHQAAQVSPAPQTNHSPSTSQLSSSHFLFPPTCRVIITQRSAAGATARSNGCSGNHAIAPYFPGKSSEEAVSDIAPHAQRWSPTRQMGWLHSRVSSNELMKPICNGAVQGTSIPKHSKHSSANAQTLIQAFPEP